MAPKIEEVDPANGRNNEQKKETKNPFEVSKKKTIRRDAKEIYGDQIRKGLNKPQYNRGTPLDKLFIKLEEITEGTIDEIDITTLASRLEIAENDSFKVRYNIVETLLDYLVEIKDLSSKQVQPDKNLIAISLHDIKTFGKLLNLIVIHGVYPPLNTFKVGIPLAKRRLKEFSNTKKPVKIDSLQSKSTAKTYTERFSQEQDLLLLLYTKFKIIFSSESDVRELLIKGTGYTDFLTISITLATCPYFKIDKAIFQREFDDFVCTIPGTYDLFQAYSLFITTQSPAYFKQFVMKRLQRLHYDAPRKDGLLTLVEFVLGLRDSEEVNIEKFDNVANVVLAKPRDIPTVDYFTSIGNQMYDLLVNINRPNVSSCIGYVLEKLWARNALVVNDFFLKRLHLNLAPIAQGSEEVLVNEKDFNNAINVLISLTNKGLNSDFYLYSFKPILLPIWGYYIFLKTHKKPVEIVQNILVSYFVSVSQGKDEDDNIYGLDAIAKAVVYSGEDWEFMLGPNSLPQIVKSTPLIGNQKENQLNDYFNSLDTACDSFIELLKNLDETLITKIFKRLLERWLKSNNKTNSLEESNPFIVLIDLRLIESIGSNFKEDIAKTPMEILDIVEEFLSVDSFETSEKVDSDDEDSDDEDDEVEIDSQAMPVLFELLSAVLTEVTEVDVTADVKEKLTAVYSKMKKLSSSSNPAVKQNFKSITALMSRIQQILSGTTPATSVKDLHKKTLERAITSLNDPLVPIRAHGLYLLKELIEAKSEVITLDFVIKLHLVQLKDPEPFVYLNVIKGLESLIELDEIPAIQELIKIYTNEDKSSDIDERLRIGEVFLRYIQKAGELFLGEALNIIVSSTISMIRRYESEDLNQDTRIRMSSMSLLGTCCRTNPLGLLNHLSDALDCAIGILQLEKDTDLAVMRRAAVVLIHDLVLGTSETENVPFPEDYRGKVFNTLSYVSETDEDLLTREQAITVLDDINELVKLAYET